ncbi:hypothetical protein FKP32DRAFT_1389525 [Trametes sanguinea]|nr:hypothetical protein FKP32DRAFT_1389525 [Trametes sanguinea]
MLITDRCPRCSVTVPDAVRTSAVQATTVNKAVSVPDWTYASQPSGYLGALISPKRRTQATVMSGPPTHLQMTRVAVSGYPDVHGGWCLLSVRAT